MTVDTTQIKAARVLTLSWGAFYLLFWLYRSAASAFGQLVIMRLTSIGDTVRYQTGDLYLTMHNLMAADIDGVRTVGTYVAHSLGAIFFLAFGGDPIMINIGFQTVAFIGIVVLLQAAKPKHRRRLAFLLLLPGFTVWTSIASKEAVVVFALGIVCSYIVKMWYGEDRLRIWHIAAFVLLMYLKPHYGGAVGYLIAVSYAARYLKQPATFALGAGLLSLVALYLVQDTMSEIVFAKVLPQFSGHGGTFIRTDFWETHGDVYLKAPQGMFLAFFGPSPVEAFTGKSLHLFSFLESLFILCALLYFTFTGIGRLPAFTLIVGSFTTLWTLFPNYPLGVMNAGAAVRYRTGYIIILFVLATVILSRESYHTWRQGKSGRRISRAAIPTRALEAE